MVCADAQCYKITWLEELVSESNTIQAQEVLLCQGRLQAKTHRNYIYIYTFEMVDLLYLWIYVFVWARVLCGPREYQSASVDCSGVIQKIHMRKIRIVQGVLA